MELCALSQSCSFSFNCCYLQFDSFQKKGSHGLHAHNCNCNTFCRDRCNANNWKLRPYHNSNKHEVDEFCNCEVQRRHTSCCTQSASDMADSSKNVPLPLHLLYRSCRNIPSCLEAPIRPIGGKPCHYCILISTELLHCHWCQGFDLSCFGTHATHDVQAVQEKWWIEHGRYSSKETYEAPEERNNKCKNQDFRKKMKKNKNKNKNKNKKKISSGY